ncbi:MAG: glucose-6-phosphate dehydrogenase [Acidobacteria bacterium]|nr:glucose-6-phosphate dehydrogenase [Acidobacteriota bacterium]MBI3489770.1 glucose-6-phosphate dehydrogenase [Acidobacteriota bacterium]
MKSLPDFDMVLLGGTGDLAMRKLLPALYQQVKAGRVSPASRVFAAARKEMTQAEFMALAEAACRPFLGEAYDAETWSAFAERVNYLPMDVRDPGSYGALGAALGGHPQRIRVYYYATSPECFAPMSAHLGAAGLISAHSRVVVEKPLGHDLDSSRAINDAIGGHFAERQIFRIDHYLGKEPVQNLLALRFGNVLFEPLWRREWVQDVQITVAEQLGMEGRGDFYDRTGALRDMLQNHLLQLLCIVAMEPPTGSDPDAVRDEKLKVLRSLKPFTAAEVAAKTVRGQYQAGAVAGQPVAAYAEEPGVSEQSRTETFVAVKVEIDTWRWAGVPFFLRTGKRMPDKLAEIVINFRPVPHPIFGESAHGGRANRLIIRMQPDESMRLYLVAKQPGEAMALQPVNLNLDFAESFRDRRLEAYERLLIDAIRGKLTLFVRRDEQEAAWSWVKPILDQWEAGDDRPMDYGAGGWGPAASSALLSRDGLAWNEEY